MLKEKTASQRADIARQTRGLCKLSRWVVMTVVAGGCFTVSGCTPDRTVPSPPGRLEDVVAGQRSLRLEENEAVINVAPIFAPDPRGGFLIADGQEAQIRRYAADGKLLWAAGKKGGGPGEFERLAAAVRLVSGEILAGDGNGRLTIFDSAGAQPLRTIATPLRQLADADVLSDSVVLLSAVGEEAVGPRLHLWNLHQDTVISSFFAPFANSANPSASTTAGWTEASIRGDTVAAIFATSDTVYFFTTSGDPLGQVAIPSQLFRRVTAEGPRNQGDFAWMGTFDLVSNVYWLSDGTLLVPYTSLDVQDAPRRIGRRYHLLRMTRSGELVFEIADAPQLLGVDLQSDSIYYVDPLADAPNSLIVARLQR